MRSLDERTEWVFKIQTTLLMVTSTIFAVTVSLSSPSEDSLCNKILLVTAISINALCILFSGISIYENKVLSNEAVRISRKYIEKYHHGELQSGPNVLYENISRKKIFVVCEKSSYISFLLLIFILVTYVAVRAFC